MKITVQKQKNCKFIDSTNEILKSFKNGPKRSRIKLSTFQVNELERSFSESPHPSQQVKEELEERLSIPIKNIQIWYQNRRAKVKTEKLDIKMKYEKIKQLEIEYENYQINKKNYYAYLTGKTQCAHAQASEKERLRSYGEYALWSRK